MKFYKSKKDLWLVIISWIAIAVIISSVVFLLASVGLTTYSFIYGALMILAAVFMVWILYNTNYAITETDLLTQCVPFKWRVPLDSINEIFPTRNPLSSPALSLDRLNIKYREKKNIMISPEDKTAFLNDIASRNPKLKLIGDILKLSD